MRILLTVVLALGLLLFGCTGNNQPNTNELIQPASMNNNNSTTMVENNSISSNNATNSSTVPTIPLQVPPQAISACQYTINSSGHYVLDADLFEIQEKDCITISADDVTLDCQDHAIIGNHNTSFAASKRMQQTGDSFNFPTPMNERTDESIGILLLNVKDVFVKNCLISNFGYTGIYLSYSSNNSIMGNGVWNNEVNGIYLYNSDGNNFVSNNIENNSLITKSSNVSSIGFTIVTISSYLNSGSIYLINSSNNDFKNNSATSSGLGIGLSTSNNNTIIENNFTLNSLGVYLDESDNNVFIKNNVSENFDSFRLSSSSENLLTGNYVTSSNNDGITLDGSNNNSFSNNTVCRNWHGIVFQYSSGNKFAGNIATNNSKNDFECSENGGNSNNDLGNICKTNSCYQWLKCRKD